MNIFLIGGSPKSGKTTLSKILSKKLGIPYVSVDTLESILQYYLEENVFTKKVLKGNNSISNDDFYSQNGPDEIMNSYISQGKISYKAIRSFVETSIIEQDSIILEGYQVTPEIVSEIKNEFHSYNIYEVFLIKTNSENLLADIHKSTTPNDWILEKTHKQETYVKITEMLIKYSQYFKKEAIKYDLEVMDLTNDFLGKFEKFALKFKA